MTTTTADTGSRLGSTEEATDRANAIKRANDLLAANQAAWMPVFADVTIDGKKVGHIVSDGYTNTSWAFYPADKSRRATPRLRKVPFEKVLPKWIGTSASLGPYQTSREITEAA